MTDKIKAAIIVECWVINENGDGTADISMLTDTGAEYSFWALASYPPKAFARTIQEEARSFSVGDYVMQKVAERYYEGNTRAIISLVYEGEEIQARLNELSDAVEQAVYGTNKEDK